MNDSAITCSSPTLPEGQTNLSVSSNFIDFSSVYSVNLSREFAFLVGSINPSYGASVGGSQINVSGSSFYFPPSGLNNSSEV